MSVTKFDIGASVSSKHDASSVVAGVFGFCLFPCEFTFQSYSPSMLVLPEVSLILKPYQTKKITLRGVGDLVSVTASLAQIARLREVSKLMTISYDDGFEDKLADAKAELINLERAMQLAIDEATAANDKAEEAMRKVQDKKELIAQIEADLQADKKAQADAEAEAEAKAKADAEAKAQAAAEAKAQAKAKAKAAQAKASAEKDDESSQSSVEDGVGK